MKTPRFSLARNLRLAAALALVAVPGLTFATAATAPATNAEDDAAKRWARFEPSFQAFAAADQAKPFPLGGILFVGSSIFRQWTNVDEMMAPLPVLNRAFGGSRTADQLARFEQVVPPYAPRVIVYYCGSNDINAGVPPETIAENFWQFSSRARARFPGTRLLYVSINRAPEKRSKWVQVDAANRLVQAFCERTPGHRFIDVNPVLFTAAGEPRLELYQKDQLHLLPAAYVEFARVIKPVLESVWAEVAK